MKNVNTIHTRIYNKLAKLIPDLATLEIGEAMNSLGDGVMMDLNLDVLYTGSNYMVISLSHYYKHPSGDLIADPDMEIRVFSDGRGAVPCKPEQTTALKHRNVFPRHKWVRICRSGSHTQLAQFLRKTKPSKFPIGF